MDLKAKYGKEMKTLEDIKRLSPYDCPMICLSNGYMSLFGLLIARVTKGFWSHAMWLFNPQVFASQWWWFTLFNVDDFCKHSLKLWYNPDWTDEEKEILLKAISNRLALGKWKTRYDFWGVIGEWTGWRWMNSKKYDFCSETMKFLVEIDPDYKKFLEKDPCPTPLDVDGYFKSNPKYKVWGRVQPG